MVQATVSSKYRTTVPKEIRQKLDIEPRDVLRWEVMDGDARVTVARRTFLSTDELTGETSSETR